MLVNNIEELRSAIEDNETEIVLAESGDFVDESDKFGESQVVSLTKKDGITIRSEDPNNPATLVGIEIKNSSNNIQIQDVKLTGWIQEDPNKKEIAAAGQVEKSNNVTFSNVIFEGRDDLALKRFGFRAKNSNDVTVENSLFSGFRKALAGSGTTDGFEVIGNEFANVGVDAMYFGNPKNLKVENNIIRDFDSEIRGRIDLNKEPGADHGDAIQFLVNKGFEAKNISIKNNVALIGDGADFQGIFIETEGGGSTGSLNNVEIENNLIHTNMANGIYLGKGKNITIRENTVVFRDSKATDSNTDKSRIAVAATENVVVENNIASFFVYDGERFGGGGKNSKEPTDGNISTNSESLIVGSDIPYEEVFKNGEMLTDPEFYSKISPEDFAVQNDIDAGANLEQLPKTMAGAPISGVSEGSGNPEPSPDPNPDSILISFGNANANNDVFGTAGDDVMQADGDSSGLRGLGRDGDDTLIGADNVDLSGENGDDLLVLKGGDSFIRGGSGSDTFKITLETESGSNILDFDRGMDTIVFEDVQGISSISDLTITPLNRNYTADSIINFGDEQIRVKNMMVEDFTSGDFDFS